MWWHRPLIPALWRKRHVELCDVSSRPARPTLQALHQSRLHNETISKQCKDKESKAGMKLVPGMGFNSASFQTFIFEWNIWHVSFKLVSKKYDRTKWLFSSVIGECLVPFLNLGVILTCTCLDSFTIKYLWKERVNNLMTDSLECHASTLVYKLCYKLQILAPAWVKHKC